MHICLISQVHNIFTNLANQLHSKNIDVSVIAGQKSKDGIIFKNNINNSINDILINDKKFWLIEKDLYFQNKVINFLKIRNIDLVITDALFPSGYLSRITKSLNIPTISFTFGIDVLHLPKIKYGFKEDPRKRKLISSVVGCLDGYIGTKESLKHLYYNWNPSSLRYKKIIIPHSFKNINLTKNNIPRLRGNFPIILSMFRIAPIKGHEYLIKSISQLKNFYPKIKLILVGRVEKEYYYNKLRKIIKANGIQDNVLFLDFLEGQKRHEILLASDIFVCSSLAEIGPRVLLLAANYKLPIISTRSGHTEDIFKHMESCIFIDKESPNSCTKAIKEVISHKSLADRLSNNAYILSKYNSWDNKIDDWIKIFKFFVKNT